jgi:hypothetical protein
MTTAQKNFATLVAGGMKPTEAYVKVFPNSTPKMRQSKPYIMLKSKAVQEAIRALQTADVEAMKVELAMSKDEGLTALREIGLSRMEKRRILAKIAKNPKVGPFARIRAIQVDNEMTGDNAPVRVEGEITLHSIFSALAGSTGLPSAQEAIEVETYDPNAPTV